MKKHIYTRTKNNNQPITWLWVFTWGNS